MNKNGTIAIALAAPVLLGAIFLGWQMDGAFFNAAGQWMEAFHVFLESEIHPVLFEQAIINLLDNAINYSNCNEGVTLRTDKTEEELIVEVIDQGCGIASEHLSRIFERFYRVNKGRSRDLGGTGLGLAIIKHVANSHGGRVTVESALNQGSTFRFHLPRKLKVR